MSIISKEYAEKAKKRAKTWFDTFIDGQVSKPVVVSKTTKSEDGTTVTQDVTLKKTALDLDALFELCDVNGIECGGMRAQVDKPGAPGRIRMTLGNQLRAAARRRHGLFDISGIWCAADTAFVDGHERTEDERGAKIGKAKPEIVKEAA